MATYDELTALFGDGNMRRKLEVAVVVSAQTILSGADTVAPFDQTAGQHELRAKWGNAALTSTETEAIRLWKYVLAANSGLTVAQIRGAADSDIQVNVDGAVDAIATAVYGV